MRNRRDEHPGVRGTVVAIGLPVPTGDPVGL